MNVSQHRKKVATPTSAVRGAKAARGVSAVVRRTRYLTTTEYLRYQPYCRLYIVNFASQLGDRTIRNFALYEVGYDCVLVLKEPSIPLTYPSDLSWTEILLPL